MPAEYSLLIIITRVVNKTDRLAYMDAPTRNQPESKNRPWGLPCMSFDHHSNSSGSALRPLQNCRLDARHRSRSPQQTFPTCRPLPGRASLFRPLPRHPVVTRAESNETPNLSNSFSRHRKSAQLAVHQQDHRSWSCSTCPSQSGQ